MEHFDTEPVYEPDGEIQVICNHCGEALNDRTAHCGSLRSNA